MNMKLWSICNDLDTVATNQEAAQDAFAYILDGLDRSACEATRGGQEASTAFLRKYYLAALTDSTKVVKITIGG